MLNKLLYFAQGHCLAEYNRSLFDEQIEAWNYGPVVPVIYHKYKVYRKGASIESEYPINYNDLFDDETIALIVSVARQYKRYSDWGLFEKSHKHNSPWYEVYVEDKKHIPITDASIKAYFKNEKLDDSEDEEFSEEELKEFVEMAKAYENGELETVSFEGLKRG